MKRSTYESLMNTWSSVTVKRINKHNFDKSIKKWQVDPVNIEPNRAEFALNAGTEPIIESNPPSFVSHHLSSEFFNPQISYQISQPPQPPLQAQQKSASIMPQASQQQHQQLQQQQQQQQRSATVARIASDLVELQKANRLHGAYLCSNNQSLNTSGNTINYAIPSSFQSSMMGSMGCVGGVGGVGGVGAAAVNPAGNGSSMGLPPPPFESFLSEIETAILRSLHPIELNEYEEITVNGERGIWANRTEVAQWRGQVPIVEYPINEDPNPQVLTKRTNQKLDYTQEIAIRYLRPPTPPAPGDIIIQQVESQSCPPAPPVVIRQQPPRPRTPEPLVIREAPPPAPPLIGRKVITISGKRLPPPPRKVIIERLAPIPPKPQSVIIERWLPYSQVKRRVIFNKAGDRDPIVVKPKNIIVQWEAPQVQIKREFKYLGVIRANPEEYRNRYGNILVTSKELPQYVLDIPTPNDLVLAANYTPPDPYYELEGDLPALQLFNLESVGLGEYRPYLTRLGILNQSLSSSDQLYQATVSSATNIPQQANMQRPPTNYSDTSLNQLNQQTLASNIVTLPVQHQSQHHAAPLATVHSSFTGSAPSAQAAQPVANFSLSSSSARLAPSSSAVDEHSLPPPQQQQQPQQPPLLPPPQLLLGNGTNESMNDIIMHIFRSIDVNRTGRIRIEDAERTFLRMNTRLDRRYGEADVYAFFNAVDLNRDRTIDFGEFRRAFLNFSNY